MTGRIWWATVRRVLAQLRRDRRTVALLLAVPTLLMVLLRYMYDGAPQIFDRIGPQLLGLFPFTTMFLVTSVAMLRERTSGTLERLLTMPLSKLDLLLGYGTAFAVVAVAQVTLAATVSITLLDLDLSGGLPLTAFVAASAAVLGTALGLFLSAFARTEFQAVQFMPAVVLPQALLCGLFVPRDQMLEVLRRISDALPLTYAVDAVTQVAEHGTVTGRLARDLA